MLYNPFTPSFMEEHKRSEDIISRQRDTVEGTREHRFETPACCCCVVIFNKSLGSLLSFSFSMCKMRAFNYRFPEVASSTTIFQAPCPEVQKGEYLPQGQSLSALENGSKHLGV